MPPGNSSSNNKATVVERCSYCGKSSCSGERNHYNSFESRTTSNVSFQASISPTYNSGTQRNPERWENVSSSTDIQNAPTGSKINSTSKTVSGIAVSRPAPKAIVLPVLPKSKVSDAVGIASSSKIEGLPSVGFNQGLYKEINELKRDGSSSLEPPKEELKVDTCKDKNQTLVSQEVGFNKVEKTELKISQISKVKEEEKSKDKNEFKIINNPFTDISECQHLAWKETDLQVPPMKHSKRAVVFEGIVAKITGSRVAEIRIYDTDRVHKFAQLFVEKLSLQRNVPACAPSTDINYVLRVGEVINLVCTEHKNKDSGFHYFAHQAWKTENETALSNNCSNYDSESVLSFASRGSLPESERQGSKASSRRPRRNKKITPESSSNDLGIVINQWLNKNESSQLSKNSSQYATLIEGFEYFGKVRELRLPYAFIVEITLEKYSECVFVYSKYFYPEGPNSESVMHGVPIKGLVNVGDGMVVVPIRSNQQKQRDFEWVARKAWPKRKDVGSKQSVIEEIQNISEQVPTKFVESIQLSNSGFVVVENDHEGVILSLQTDWGLVRELKNGSVYVFARKNTYLFGLCLKKFALEDVLQEGELVRFSLEDGEKGQMNAKLLYFGYQLPDFNSFTRVMHDYCQERRIKFSVEMSLTMLGEELYSFK